VDSGFLGHRLQRQAHRRLRLRLPRRRALRHDGRPPYVNTGLTGGTTYYYVVSSVNTIVTCESANSLEVTATRPVTAVRRCAHGDGHPASGQVLLT